MESLTFKKANSLHQVGVGGLIDLNLNEHIGPRFLPIANVRLRQTRPKISVWRCLYSALPIIFKAPNEGISFHMFIVSRRGPRAFFFYNALSAMIHFLFNHILYVCVDNWLHSEQNCSHTDVLCTLREDSTRGHTKELKLYRTSRLNMATLEEVTKWSHGRNSDSGNMFITVQLKSYRNRDPVTSPYCP